MPMKTTFALKGLLPLGLLLTALVAGPPASAQPRPPPSAEARVAAQALFEEGRRLMVEKRYLLACAKFKESQRLDPGIGTQFNLGDCYEQAGKLASAWIQFVDVAAALRATGQHKREQAARKRAAVLAPRLIRMRIEVAEPVDGLVIKRDGLIVAPAQYSTPIPVDPGTVMFEAMAPGKVRWRKRVKARKEGRTITVVVGPLRKAAAGGGKKGPKGPGDNGDQPQPRTTVVRRGAAWALGGVGLVAVGVGATAGAVAIDKKNESAAFCPQPDACFDEGLALRAEARTAAAVSTVGFSIAAGAFVGAVVLWLAATPPDSPKEPKKHDEGQASAQVWVLPSLQPTYAGGTMIIAF